MEYSLKHDAIHYSSDMLLALGKIYFLASENGQNAESGLIRNRIILVENFDTKFYPNH